MGHLLSFTGTDTVAAIDTLEGYYLADAEKELIGGSVPASEHSCQCAGSADYNIYNSVEEKFNEETQEWEIVRFIA
jgi:hypothetical protein